MYLLNTLYNYCSETRYVKNLMNSGTGPDSILFVDQYLDYDVFNERILNIVTYIKSNLLFFKVEILKYSSRGYTFEDPLIAQIQIISVLKKSLYF